MQTAQTCRLAKVSHAHITALLENGTPLLQLRWCTRSRSTAEVVRNRPTGGNYEDTGALEPQSTTRSAPLVIGSEGTSHQNRSHTSASSEDALQSDCRLDM